MCGNLNVTQAMSQQAFKVTTPSAWTHACSLFATDQSHCPPCYAEIQPISQTAAAATCPYQKLVLDTHAPASCLKCGNLLDLDEDNCQDNRLATCWD